MASLLKNLKKRDFISLIKNRQKRFAAASDAPPSGTDAARELARALHPKKQYLKVAEVIERAPDTKSFVLVPDETRGTKALAYFGAGKYLTVFAEIGGKTVTRAYSISSAPRAALEGRYELTIKLVDGGLVSRWILDTWQVGSEVEVSAPAGNFEYQPLRDAPTVIGLAGGSGITPFLSMAKAIRDGDEDFCLTLLYGSKTADGILFKEELDAIAAATDKVRVIHVLSDEAAEGMRHGFLTAELIREFAPADAPYSVFLCGSQQMYAFVDKEVEKLGLAKKYVRHELFGEFHNPASLPEYAKNVPATVNITVTVQDKTVTVTGSTQDSVMQILEKNGVAVPARCRSGECGFCHTHMLSGEVFVPKHLEFRRMADAQFGCIHPCCSFPLTDLVLNVPAAK
jgi:ferredoxin-NADP reductase